MITEEQCACPNLSLLSMDALLQLRSRNHSVLRLSNVPTQIFMQTTTHCKPSQINKFGVSINYITVIANVVRDSPHRTKVELGLTFAHRDRRI